MIRRREFITLLGGAAEPTPIVDRSAASHTAENSNHLP